MDRANWHSEGPTQAALASFIDEGLIARHIRKTASKRRAARITEGLQCECALLQLVPSAAGLHLAARVAPGASLDIDKVVDRAATTGVAVHALSRFCGEAPAQAGLVIGYGAIPTAKIEEGLRRLPSRPAHVTMRPLRVHGRADSWCSDIFRSAS